jgi:hypothetical protein
MSCEPEPLGHIETHLAQADKSKFHSFTSFLIERLCRSQSMAHEHLKNAGAD